MRRIARSRLAIDAQAKLDALRCKVHDAFNDAGVAARLWENRTRSSAFEQVRAALAAMAPGAPGVPRCMYCNANESVDIDHFRPLSQYPGHAFVWSNLLLACGICNNHKRDRFPLDDEGRAVLLDPTWDTPSEHLEYGVTDGRFIGVDRRGEVSISTCDLNGDAPNSRRRGLRALRIKTWRALCQALRRYDECLSQGRTVDAEIEREDLLMEPVASLLVWLVRNREDLSPDLRDIVERRDISAWVRGW